MRCAAALWLAAAAALNAAPPRAQEATICDRAPVAGAPSMAMLLWRGPTEVEAGVRDYLDARDVRVNVTCLSAGSESENVPGIVAEARDLDVDLVYTWGTSVTLAAVGRADEVDPAVQITDVPVVFTMVSYPVEAGIVPSFDETGRNITGSSHTVPLTAQIRAMQAYRPVTSIGALYNPLEVNSTISIQRLAAAAAQEGIEVIAVPVELDAGGEPDPSRLPDLIERIALRQPQFLFIGPDNFIGTHRDAVISAALARGLPAFTGTELEIAQGRAMVGLVTSYYNLGQYMGSLVERVLVDGEDPRDIPVRTLDRFTYMIRLPVAQQLQLWPPLDLLGFARVFREPVE